MGKPAMELDVNPEEIQSKLRLLRRPKKKNAPLTNSVGQPQHQSLESLQLSSEVSPPHAYRSESNPLSPCSEGSSWPSSPPQVRQESSSSGRMFTEQSQAFSNGASRAAIDLHEFANAPSYSSIPCRSSQKTPSPIRTAGSVLVDSAPRRMVGQSSREDLAPYAYVSLDSPLDEEAEVFHGRQLRRSFSGNSDNPVPASSSTASVAPLVSKTSQASCADDTAPTTISPTPKQRNHITGEAIARRAARAPASSEEETSPVTSPSSGRRIPRSGGFSSTRMRDTPADTKEPGAHDHQSPHERTSKSTFTLTGTGGNLEVNYLSYEELEVFSPPPGDRLVVEVLEAVASADWAVQFRALDDIRRLARFTPRLLIGPTGNPRLRKVTAAVSSLADSLRSALAKNGLVALGELFRALGSSKQIDLELENCLQVAFKRAADTNSFISGEAENLLREICKAANEGKAVVHLLAFAAHRRAEIRARAVKCLAMVAQRLIARGPAGYNDLRSIADLAAKALSDASPDVRQSARFAAVIMQKAVAEGSLDGPAAAKLHGAVPAGIDVASFDAFDSDSAQWSTDCSRSTPSSAQSGMRVIPRQAMPLSNANTLAKPSGNSRS